MQLVQEGEQRRPLERRILLQLPDHPGPDLGERIGPGAVAAGLLELAGQLREALIFPRGALAHAGPRGGLGLGAAGGTFSEHATDLRVAFHGALLVGTMFHQRRGPAAQAAILVFVGSTSNLRPTPEGDHATRHAAREPFGK